MGTDLRHAAATLCVRQPLCVAVTAAIADSTEA